MMKIMRVLDLISNTDNQTNRSYYMSMVAVEVIMEMTGLDKNSVRRIGRNIKTLKWICMILIIGKVSVNL